MLDDDAREASLLDTLARWNRDEPVWVFGYGSLIWRPEFTFDAKARGLVHGYHRSLCLWSRIYRGTPEKPGLVLGLEPGGSVHGVAFRIPAAIAHRELRALWARELLTGSYLPRWLEVRLGSDRDERSVSRVRAIGFVMNRSAVGYAGEIDRGLLLETVCTASGRNGTCAEYVLSTVRSLAAYGIYDRRLAALAAEIGMKTAAPP